MTAAQTGSSQLRWEEQAAGDLERTAPPGTSDRDRGFPRRSLRLWAAAHDGLHCFDPDGTLLGKLRFPEIVSNLTFGGPQRNHLFVTASTSVYTVRVNFRGVRYPDPGRRGLERGQRPREG